MRKIAFLLFLAATPALSQIRPDQALAPAVIGAAASRQQSARVASDGTNFFAVWKTRVTPTTVVIGGGRISPAGELLDRPSVLLATGVDSTLGDPDVVFVGGNFLVAYRSGTSTLMRRFSRDGRLLDQPVVIGNSRMPAWLATNGTNVFLATASNRFRLLAPDGTPLGAERDIPNAGIGAPSVASNGDRYLAAYSLASGSTHGVVVLLTGNGDYLAAQPLPFGVFPTTGAVTTASNGTSFLVAIASNGPALCISVDADGHLGAAQTLENKQDDTVAATWSGSEYTLVWLHRFLPAGSAPKVEAVVGARVDAAGVPIDTTPIVIASLDAGHSAKVFGSASNGRDTIVITADSYRDLTTTAAIFTSLPHIDAEPDSRRRAAIASSAPEQAGGSIASNGTLSLVAWRERSGLNQAVARAAFVAADGQLGAPIDVGEADALTTTATASNGRDFLVVYVDPGLNLVARRVALTGVLDPVPIVIKASGVTANAGLAAAWSGQAYVIATAEADGAVTISGISPDGVVVVSPQPTYDSGPFDTPAVSCTANGCSVTWHWVSFPCFTLCFSAENDGFTRTDAYGKVVWQVFLTDFGGVTPARSLPAAAGTSMFVYSNGKTMFAGRITAGGVVLDTPLPNGGVRIMTSETSFALQPVSAVNGGLYFIEPDDATNGRLYWARIEPEPTPHATALVNLHQTVTFPLTLTASARNTYFLYSRGEDDQNLMASRLFLRTLASPDPQTSPVRRHAVR